MGNRGVNYPDIIPQEQPLTQLSPSCNARVKIDVNVFNNTRNDINSWKVIQASSAHLTNIFEMVNHPVIKILMVPDSIIRKRHHLANFQIAVKTRWQNSVQWFSIFLYHDLWKNAWKTFCIRIGHVIRRSGIKCCLSKWRHRIKRQS